MRVLVTTQRDRYQWEPFLQLIDVIPKGKRIPRATLHLGESQNTELRAMRKIARHILEDYSR